MVFLTVSQLNRYIKAVIEEDKKLADVYIKGEISNFTRHFKSGHFYFSLKDENSAVRAVCFKSYAGQLEFEPENGMAVLARANVGVYERDGLYQLYVTDMQPDGAGALAVAFEQRKRKLMNLGMFDAPRKKPLPAQPRRIGVVTSQTGAALKDIINVITRRYPLCTLVLSPAQVQGENAAAIIIKALKTLDGKCDVIILARGGGSAEDLWAFNDEALAHAIFEAITPVVSAVGHETDFTISDFVADLRAPTPSAAAELVTPSIESVYQKLLSYRGFFMRDASFLINKSSAELAGMRRKPGLSSPMDYVVKNQQRLDFFARLLYNRKQLDLKKFEQALASRAALIYSLSPLSVLARGFSVTFKDNKAVSRASSLAVGEEISLRFSKGAARARVLEVEPEE